MPETIQPLYFLHIMGVVLIVYSLAMIFYYSKTTPGTINAFGGYGCFREWFRANQEIWEASQKIAGRWFFGFGVIEIVLGFLTNAFPPTFNGPMFQAVCIYLSLPLSMIGIEIHMRKKFTKEGQRK